MQLSSDKGELKLLWSILHHYVASNSNVFQISANCSCISLRNTFPNQRCQITITALFAKIYYHQICSICSLKCLIPFFFSSNITLNVVKLNPSKFIYFMNRFAMISLLFTYILVHRPSYSFLDGKYREEEGKWCDVNVLVHLRSQHNGYLFTSFAFIRFEG